MITYSALHEAYSWVGQTSLSFKAKQERSIMPPNSDKLPFLVKNPSCSLSEKLPSPFGQIEGKFL